MAMFLKLIDWLANYYVHVISILPSADSCLYKFVCEHVHILWIQNFEDL